MLIILIMLLFNSCVFRRKKQRSLYSTRKHLSVYIIRSNVIAHISVLPSFLAAHHCIVSI